jgi:hypothetical protein
MTAILFYGTPEDRQYLPYLKPYIGTHKCHVLTTPITTLYEIESYCKARDITGVITTSPALLQKLAGRDKPVSLDAFSGSYFKRNGLEYVILKFTPYHTANFYSNASLPRSPTLPNG